jgi:hypothetical protein
MSGVSGPLITGLQSGSSRPSVQFVGATLHVLLSGSMRRTLCERLFLPFLLRPADNGNWARARRSVVGDAPRGRPRVPEAEVVLDGG